jgi:hypothetical protein
MTEKAKIARLWSGFHRLPADDRDLLLKVTAALPRRDKPGSREVPAKWARARKKDG